MWNHVIDKFVYYLFSSNYIVMIEK